MTQRVDERVVYGATCAWWGSIRDVAKKPSGLPCCPECGGVLFDIPSEADWWSQVDAHQQAGHPGYRAFIEWLRGRCFPNFDAAERAYVARALDPGGDRS